MYITHESPTAFSLWKLRPKIKHHSLLQLTKDTVYPISCIIQISHKSSYNDKVLILENQVILSSLDQ